MVYQGKMFNAFRDGKVFVCAKRCGTCIFGPNSPVDAARRDEMAVESVKRDTAIICHSTLGGDNAVCKGFFDAHKTTPLQVAERLGMLSKVKVD